MVALAITPLCSVRILNIRLTHILYTVTEFGKVRTFWETHKNLEKSANLLSKRQNHEEDFFKLCMCASQKV